MTLTAPDSQELGASDVPEGWRERRPKAFIVRARALLPVLTLIPTTGMALLFALGPRAWAPANHLLALVLGALALCQVRALALCRVSTRKKWLRQLGEGAIQVSLRLERDGIELGRDTGHLWQDGHVLRYEGKGTGWGMSNATMTTFSDPGVQGHWVWFKADADGIPLMFSFRRHPWGDQGKLQEMLDQWRESRVSSASPRLKPPTTPRRRTFGWYAERTWERAIGIQLMLSISLIGPQLFNNSPIAVKIELFCWVLGLHLLWRSYARLRRTDDEDRMRLLAEDTGVRRVET